MEKPTRVKERIVAATIELIAESKGDVATISTRAIAERAHVGVSMINYHFQTKERLMEICVEQIIGNEITSFRPGTPASEQTPVGRARHVAKLVADFLFDNPAVSRISILSDVSAPKDNDNTMRSVSSMASIIEGLPLTERERHIAAFAIVSAMQALFLRPELFGIDMQDKRQRNEVLDFLIGNMLETGRT